VFENRGLSSSVAIRGNPDLGPDRHRQAAVQHLFARDISGQFAVFFKDIWPISTRAASAVQSDLGLCERDRQRPRLPRRASPRLQPQVLGEVNYTYQIATGVASDLARPASSSRAAASTCRSPSSPRLGPAQHSPSGVVRDPGRWGFRFLWQYGSGFPFTPTFRNDRKPDPALDNSRRLPSNSILTVDGDKYFRVWGQNVTLFFDARNVLGAKNINNLSYPVFPNPFVGQSGDEYQIYFTETGRAGGAYLQDTNGDNFLDWVPVHDPRVFQEGRSVRMGVSVTF
jgi:hypothetical protein